jgi:hypothetical protein
MIRKLSTWLLIALAAVVILAGCGGSSSMTASQSSTPAATSSTPAARTTSSATTSSPAKTPAVASAVESCKRSAKAIPTLSAATRTKIESICDKAASGNVGDTRVAAREVCEEIVRASPLPEGSAKQHAIAACKAAEKQK